MHSSLSMVMHSPIKPLCLLHPNCWPPLRAAASIMPRSHGNREIFRGQSRSGMVDLKDRTECGGTEALEETLHQGWTGKKGLLYEVIFPLWTYSASRWIKSSLQDHGPHHLPVLHFKSWPGWKENKTQRNVKEEKRGGKDELQGLKRIKF